MAGEYRIRVIYHQQPDKTMRAINFFSAAPKLLGKPLYPNTILLVDRQTLDENRIELEPLLDTKVISITGRDGQPFKYKQDVTFSEDLLTEEQLEAEVRAAIERQVQNDLAGIVDPTPPRKVEIPPEFPKGEPASLPIELPPELPPEIPAELPVEPLASSANDEFFRQVKEHADKRRKPSRRRQKAAV